MFKRILVPMGDSGHSAVALENACIIAREFDSIVKCLYVADDQKFSDVYIAYQMPKTMMSPMQEPLYGADVIELITERLKKEKDAVITCYNEMQNKYNDISITFEDITGVLWEEVKDREKDADLVVMGKALYAEEESIGLISDEFRDIVHRSILPVIACTKNGFIGKNLMLCYDGKKPAKKALKIAADVALKYNSPVYVFTSENSLHAVKKINSEAMALLKELGVNDVRPVISLGNSVKAIITETINLKIDFLFMGAYGSSPLKDLILGSTTDRVVKFTSSPVLLYR